jgi:hypothetical protein
MNPLILTEAGIGRRTVGQNGAGVFIDGYELSSRAVASAVVNRRGRPRGQNRHRGCSAWKRWPAILPTLRRIVRRERRTFADK